MDVDVHGEVEYGLWYDWSGLGFGAWLCRKFNRLRDWRDGIACCHEPRRREPWKIHRNVCRCLVAIDLWICIDAFNEKRHSGRFALALVGDRDRFFSGAGAPFLFSLSGDVRLFGDPSFCKAACNYRKMLCCIGNCRVFFPLRIRLRFAIDLKKERPLKEPSGVLRGSQFLERIAAVDVDRVSCPASMSVFFIMDRCACRWVACESRCLVSNMSFGIISLEHDP